MKAVVFGSSLVHRAVRPDADPRLLWTACGIRFVYDRTGYAFAKRTVGNPVSGRCPVCLG